MTKKSNSALIIWAVVALVVGILLGLLITNLTTTGQAKLAVSEKKLTETTTPNPDSDIDIDLDIDLYLRQYEYEGQFTGEFKTDFEEGIYSDSPARLEKEREIQVYSPNFDLIGAIYSDDVVYLEEESGGGYIYDSQTDYDFQYPGYSPRIDFMVYAENDGADGEENFSESITENEYNYPFANVTQFTYNCDGQYQMSHTDVGGVDHVFFSLSIYEENNEDDDDGNHWYYSWDIEPLRTDNYYGYFPPEATAILNNGNSYRVYFSARIYTNQDNETRITSWKNLNCANGELESISKTEGQKLENKYQPIQDDK